jgi:DNA-binding LytR/AlgR family response regulator
MAAGGVDVNAAAAAVTALIADDEPVLRRGLKRMLATLWPELSIVAEARNGREAVDLFELHRPAVCFLDVHMPAMSGVEAAQLIGRRAHVVFVTAYHQYAVQAFERGAVDYILKPVQPPRLADTVGRLRDRLAGPAPRALDDAVLEAIAARLERRTRRPGALRWLRASVGDTIRLIAVDEVDFLRAEDKYTTVAWRDASGRPSEAIVRLGLTELAAQLDPEQFVQVHRSVVVNLKSIRHITRGQNDTAEIRMHGRDDVLPVSRSRLHLFRQM